MTVYLSWYCQRAGKIDQTLAVGSRITCKSAATPFASCCPIWFHQCFSGSRPTHPARAEMKAHEWSMGQNPEYKNCTKNSKALRDNLKKRFDRSLF